MHLNEVAIDALLVARLLAEQFPQWADWPLRRVASSGTDNALYRLGKALVVRLPRIPSAAEQIEKEQCWLPRLAPYLPLAIPEPVAKGQPGGGYPWYWSVYTWLEGENHPLELLEDPRQAALDLAGFIQALQKVDSTGGPQPGAHNAFRGLPLGVRDRHTRIAIESLRGTMDAEAMTAVWEDALRAPVWHGAPVWIHGDLQGLNLLTVDGRLRAVIDFGCLGIGDPATDIMAAWLYLNAETREIFRAALQVDDATWSRGRGWALSMGLIALPYYKETNPILARIARRAIEEALTDFSPDSSS